jgi:hypothetical protein
MVVPFEVPTNVPPSEVSPDVSSPEMACPPLFELTDSDSHLMGSLSIFPMVVVSTMPPAAGVMLSEAPTLWCSPPSTVPMVVPTLPPTADIPPSTAPMMAPTLAPWVAPMVAPTSAIQQEVQSSQQVLDHLIDQAIQAYESSSNWGEFVSKCWRPERVSSSRYGTSPTLRHPHAGQSTSPWSNRWYENVTVVYGTE